MHRYGELADEITEMIEELELPQFKSLSRSLVGHLQKAFNEACLLERHARTKAQATGSETGRPARLRQAPADEGRAAA